MSVFYSVQLNIKSHKYVLPSPYTIHFHILIHMYVYSSLTRLLTHLATHIQFAPKISTIYNLYNSLLFSIFSLYFSDFPSKTVFSFPSMITNLQPLPLPPFSHHSFLILFCVFPVPCPMHFIFIYLIFSHYLHFPRFFSINSPFYNFSQILFFTHYFLFFLPFFFFFSFLSCPLFLRIVF